MNQYINEEQAKKDICEIGKRMYQKGFASGNDGNISIRTGENEIWTTPTGVSKGFMESEMMVKVDLEGNVLEGSLKPSSEVKLHLRVYKDRPQITSVVHAHPPYSTAYAVAGIALDKPIMAEAIVFLGKIPIAPYGTPSTEEVPKSIEPYTRGHNALLLANHGALTWGKDIFDAYYRMENLEFYAQISYLTQTLGKANSLPQDKVSELVELRGKMGISFQ
jgi:L-fuculose-phosphate aldolase